MATRSVRFPDELLFELDEAAQKRHVSTNWLIIKILEENVERIKDPELFRVTT